MLIGRNCGTELPEVATDFIGRFTVCGIALPEAVTDFNEILVVDVPGSFCRENILFAIFFLFSKESSIYPSATVEDFQPPCRLIVEKSAPASAKNVAEFRLKQCPVYSEASGSFRYSAINLGIFPMVFTPTG